MISNLGYEKKLFILPFDHRASFAKMLGFDDKNLTQKQKQIMKANKKIIFQAFKKSVSENVPKNQAAILVDEEYGNKIIRDAVNQNYIVLVTTEKSGQKEFTFEYQNQFGKHLEKYKPTFAKALIRYRPNMECKNLKKLSDYCHKAGYKFLFEILTENKTANEAVAAIKEFQSAGVEPDVWKLEGMETKKKYQAIVRQAQSHGRSKVGVVVLGRGADQPTVEKWIATGAKVKGIIGFAVGRTVFSQPLTEYKDGKITKRQAIQKISDNFLHFYRIFINS